MFELGGMHPQDALRSATLHGPRYRGMDHALGSPAEGKLADVVVLRANPLDAIRNSEGMAYVMKNGRLYDTETMHEIGTHPRERGDFFFERPGVSDNQVWRGLEVQQCSCGATHAHGRP